MVGWEVMSRLTGRMDIRASGNDSSAISQYGDGGTVNQFRAIATQEHDDTCDVFWFRPLREFCLWHGLAVCLRIDDAGQNGVRANPGALQVFGKRIHHGYRRSLGSGVLPSLSGRGGLLVVSAE